MVHASGLQQFAWEPGTRFPAIVLEEQPLCLRRELGFSFCILYAYDQFLYPVKLDDNDFDPNVIWKKD